MWRQIFKQEDLDGHELEVSIKEGVGGCDTVGGETQGMVRGGWCLPGCMIQTPTGSLPLGLGPDKDTGRKQPSVCTGPTVAS